MNTIRTLLFAGLLGAPLSNALAVSFSGSFFIHPITDSAGNPLQAGSFVELGLSGPGGSYQSLDSVLGSSTFNTSTADLALGTASNWFFTGLSVDTISTGLAGQQLRIRVFNGPDNTGNDFLDVTSTTWIITEGDGSPTDISVFFFSDTDLTTNVGLGDGPDELLPETIVFRGTFDRFRFDGVGAGGTFEGFDNVSAFSTDVPEPGSVAAVFGVLAGGVVLALRRRTRRKV